MKGRVPNPLPQPGDYIVWTEKKRNRYERGHVLRYDPKNPNRVFVEMESPYMIGHLDGRIETYPIATVMLHRIEVVRTPCVVRFKTESGSEYELNREQMRWKRLSPNPASPLLRTESGDLRDWPTITVGQPAKMIGKGLLFGARLILTTPVTEARISRE